MFFIFSLTSKLVLQIVTVPFAFLSFRSCHLVASVTLMANLTCLFAFPLTFSPWLFVSRSYNLTYDFVISYRLRLDLLVVIWFMNRLPFSLLTLLPSIIPHCSSPWYTLFPVFFIQSPSLIHTFMIVHCLSLSLSTVICFMISLSWPSSLLYPILCFAIHHSVILSFPYCSHSHQAFPMHL